MNKTTSTSRPGFSQSEIEELREAFNLFDLDGNGTIDARELKAAMESLGFESRNRMVYEMISDVDKNGSGDIDFEEFLDIMTIKLGDSGSEDDIRKVFNLFDDDKTGYISLQNLKRVTNELGETFTDSELLEMIERVDSSGEGHVNFDDFFKIMTRKTFA